MAQNTKIENVIQQLLEFSTTIFTKNTYYPDVKKAGVFRRPVVLGVNFYMVFIKIRVII